MGGRFRAPKRRSGRELLHAYAELTADGADTMTVNFDLPVCKLGTIDWPAFKLSDGTPCHVLTCEVVTPTQWILTFAAEYDPVQGLQIPAGDPNVRSIYGGYIFPKFGRTS